MEKGVGGRYFRVCCVVERKREKEKKRKRKREKKGVDEKKRKERKKKGNIFGAGKTPKTLEMLEK